MSASDPIQAPAATTAAAETATPNKALTIPRRRLAGSPACLNCGTKLKGPFCYYCGQPDKNLMRFFPVLVRDLLEDLLDFDSRFMRTMRPLLFHPGKLTRDYLDGRRFRYVTPMRLYIFSSMIFFILAATFAGNAVDIVRDADGKPGGIHLNIDGDGETNPEVTAEIEAAVNEALEEVVAGGRLSAEQAGSIAETVQERAGLDVAPPPADSGSAADGDSVAQDETNGESGGGTEEEEEDAIMINGERWDRESNPFRIAGFPGFINDWINDEIEESPQKGREIEENPNLIIDKVFDVMPVAVFVMLPLVALLFKFWYLFAGNYYVEHLIHALHNHAFLFVVFILTSVSDGIAAWLDPAEAGRPTEISSWVTVILLCWIPLYLLISLKTVYRQGWFMTFTKFSLIGVSYLVLLAMVTSAAAVAGFVLL